MLRVQNMAGDAVEIPYQAWNTMYAVRKAVRSTLFTDQQNTADCFWKCTLFYEQDGVYRVIGDEERIIDRPIYAVIKKIQLSTVWYDTVDWEDEIQYGDEAMDYMSHHPMDLHTCEIVNEYGARIPEFDNHCEDILPTLKQWIEQERTDGRLAQPENWKPWDTGSRNQPVLHGYRVLFSYLQYLFQLTLYGNDCVCDENGDDPQCMHMITFRFVLKWYGIVHDGIVKRYPCDSVFCTDEFSKMNSSWYSPDRLWKFPYFI